MDDLARAARLHRRATELCAEAQRLKTDLAVTLARARRARENLEKARRLVRMTRTLLVLPTFEERDE